MFSLPLKQTPIDEYVLFLTYLVLHSFAMMRWEIVHYGTGGPVLRYIDYHEFLAQVGFMVPADYVDSAWNDFLMLHEEMYKHWVRMDMPDAYHPANYFQHGGYHVIEVRFEFYG